MPLGEAAAVLEQYFARHGYVPSHPARGGIALPALKAAYAVGTTLGWDPEDPGLEARRAWMIQLLERCGHAFAARRDGQDPMGEGDAAVIRQTIEAIRDDKAGFTPQFLPHQGVELVGPAEIVPSELVPNAGPTAAHHDAPEGISRDEIVELVRQAVDARASTQATGGGAISQLDLILAKHGVELLEREVRLTERRLDDKFDAVDKVIDRHLSNRQVEMGRTQVQLSKWAIVVAVLLWVASVATSVAIALWLD